MAKILNLSTRKDTDARRGSIVVIFLLLLVALISVGAMAVDLALVSAARTDLRIVTDLTSKAASIEFTESSSIPNAQARAQEIAARNDVIGTSEFSLAAADIVAGHSSRLSGDRYSFEAGASPTNSFRVNGSLGGDSVNVGLQALFPGIHRGNETALSQFSTSTEIYLDIVLVLDRSGSMAFDMSGNDWSYPNGWSWTYNYFMPPQQGSRWVSLEGAIDVFLSEMGRKEKKERVALVTYSSDNTSYSSYFRRYYYADEVTTNHNFTTDYEDIQEAVDEIGNSEIIGGTAISSGIDRARYLLRNSSQAGFAEKNIVLMTDGQWNVGYNPVNAAYAANDEDVTIHAISFGPGTNHSVMQDIASATGGTAYNAATEEELREAFREIARSIQLSLTE